MIINIEHTVHECVTGVSENLLSAWPLHFENASYGPGVCVCVCTCVCVVCVCVCVCVGVCMCVGVWVCILAIAFVFVPYMHVLPVDVHMWTYARLCAFFVCVAGF